MLGMSDAVMLHYSVNKPIGALMGESDLTTIIPWLLSYSRMLEDRVRLHWAARAFLYLVTVPSNKVESKSAQYGISTREWFDRRQRRERDMGNHHPQLAWS